MARELHVDESMRGVCPKCKSDEGFVITRKTSHAAYICHRATCDFKGFVAMTLMEPDLAMPVFAPLKGKPLVAKKMDFDLVNLPDDVCKYLKGMYFFSEDELNATDWKWMPKEERLWMPMGQRDYTTIGGVARSLNRDVSPKTLNYVWNTDVPLASWHMYEWSYTHPQKCLWLVEDQISAQRLSKHAEACALLGTNVSDALISKIKEHYDEVVLALDRDALPKSLILQKKMNPFVNTRVRPLKRDIKNMPSIDIIEMVAVSNRVIGK